MPNPSIGVIRIFPYTKWQLPAGWLQCDGSQLAISQYPDLFNVIRTIYGGDGVSNFWLPQLSMSVLLGVNNAGGAYPIGGSGGAQFTNLRTKHLPPHSHPLIGMRSAAMLSGSAGIQPYPSSGDTTLGAFSDPGGSAVNLAYNNAAPNVPLNAGPAFSATLGNNGSEDYLMLQQPTMILTFAICAE